MCVHFCALNRLFTFRGFLCIYLFLDLKKIVLSDLLILKKKTQTNMT